MTVLERTGKTIEEAVQAGLAELKLPMQRIEYEVLEAPSKGIFGLIGQKPARVRITVKKVDVLAAATEFLQNVFASMQLPSITIEKMTQKDEDGLVLNIHGNNLGILIGKHGQTLDALQYLTNMAANKDAGERVKIVLDVEDYRKRRAETLTSLAIRLANQVKRRGEKVVLEPMSPLERKIIHMALQDDPRVTTYSEGEEPYRKVIIALKK
ncbi:RNA-binding cell elongation regulator Jag/EloR [Acetonema longum]|uniref:RNA-binding protein KhpB n=1 Tax=Acetonema longum DSM 6540 TaxID=1009370 RepID=F7NFW8_9FIRM|nr:RNA-binding cell elongation regulator Jag/EloR [Acetonema longum]EGO65076.1 single-stranded nucleic acid binding r3h [Acetonema longum DSM 6540]